VPDPLARLSQLAVAALRRGFERIVAGADDATLERRLGSDLAQSLLFGAMARSFRAEAAEGFRGTVGYSLTRPATGGPVSEWVIEVGSERASARRRAGGDAAATAVSVTIPLADFARIAAGEIDPAEPMLSSRATVRGELSVAARLAEMFGAPELR
jgi:putative sterol carrier protein